MFTRRRIPRHVPQYGFDALHNYPAIMIAALNIPWEYTSFLKGGAHGCRIKGKLQGVRGDIDSFDEACI